MSKLIHEINALLVLRKLFEILPTHPVNLGKAYVMGSILAKECVRRQKEFNISYTGPKIINLDYFQLLFSYIARRMPLNNLFFSENAPEIIADVVADLVKNSMMGATITPKIEGENERLQKYLSQICTWGVGCCFNYAALALYHLLEEGVRPVDVLWINDPVVSNPAKPIGSIGHQIIVIGLPSNESYTNLAKSDALVLDFWAGTILKSSEYFKAGSPFHGFDRSVIPCYRIQEGEENPFKKPYAEEPAEIKAFKLSVSARIMSIITARKNSGEYISTFRLNKTYLDKSKRDGANIADVHFNQRTAAIYQNLSKLGIFEQAAKTIQKKVRSTSHKNQITKKDF